MKVHAYQTIAHHEAQKVVQQYDSKAVFALHPQCSVDMPSFRAGLLDIQATLGKECTVQAALVLYLQTKELSALQHYFPIIGWLDAPLRHRWVDLYSAYLRTSPLRIEYIRQQPEPAPLAIRAMVVGQLVSCFLFRPDVLAAFSATQPIFSVCADARVYGRVGGVGGGCYDEGAHRMILTAGRLFEGYWQPTPGVCPFLHELGHMLDGAERRLRGGRHCSGVPAGLQTDQRSAWQAGKQQEVQRYRDYQRTGTIFDTAPLGHPYVFQTDGEFLAGYWEMFWRNPHAFALHSPILYGALAAYVGHDPRSYTTDYTGYVQGNQAFYAAGERAWPSQIRDEPTPP